MLWSSSQYPNHTALHGVYSLRLTVLNLEVLWCSIMRMYYYVLLSSEKGLSSDPVWLFCSYAMELGLHVSWMQQWFCPSLRLPHIGMSLGMCHAMKWKVGSVVQSVWNIHSLVLIGLFCQWLCRCFRCWLLHWADQRICRNCEEDSCRDSIQRAV